MSRHLFSHGAPGLPLYLSEPVRASVDYALLLATSPLMPLLPRGDGHPVLVLPGRLATDCSTAALRWVLGQLGYPVEGWLLGSNAGPTGDVVGDLGRRLLTLSEQHDRPVTVIGWSLGGIYARALAHHFPDAVRQVITLGSPFRLAGDQPIRAPRTSIYSRLDGVVSWQACLDDVTPRSENVEVLASHLGLGHHPAVLWAVADRLAQPEGEWRPFRAPLAALAAFPAPSSSPAPSSHPAPPPPRGRRKTS